MARTIGLCALVFAVLVALPSLSRADGEDARLATLEKQMTTLSERMARIEKFLPSLDRWERVTKSMLVGPTEKKWKKDLSNLRMISGLLLALGGELPLKDGALDVYLIYRKGIVVGARNFEVFVSARNGFGPTPEEAKGGDYQAFPYWRYKGAKPPPRNSEIPILWDKRGQNEGLLHEPYGKGMRLVAFANGDVKTVRADELNRLLKAAGQDHK